jgi:uncharacterized protein YndB with AHSA1/START domain
MKALPHSLERSVLICATRSTVFRFFTDPVRFADWWGAGSSIEGRPGGAVLIRYPDGSTASGTVLELVDDERIVFTYGYDAPGKPIPPGGSRVTVTLSEHPRGTLLQLRHELAEPGTVDEHVRGWRYQLALFANAAARDQHRDLDGLVDRYFALWSEPDAGARRRGLGELTTSDVRFGDAFGATCEPGELDAHIAAVHVFMPGMRLAREGQVRHCQGSALVDWIATGSDGAPRGRGTNLFDLAPDGRIARIVGFWSR